VIIAVFCATIETSGLDLVREAIESDDELEIVVVSLSVGEFERC